MTAFSRARVVMVVAALAPALVATALSAQAPVRVGGDVKEPKVLFKQDPVYPAIARQAKVEGQVIIEATIARDGTVRDVRVLRGNPLLNDAAVEAVKKWKYEPTLVNGVRTDVLMTVIVSFSLNDGPQADVNALLQEAKAARDAGRLADVEQLLQRALEQVRTERSRQQTTPEPSAASPMGPIRVGGDVKEPRRLTYVAPAYPADALNARVEGQAIVEATIGTDGKVKNVRILRSLPIFEQAARDAVSQWVYEPATLNGVPVEVLMTVVVNFTLR